MREEGEEARRSRLRNRLRAAWLVAALFPASLLLLQGLGRTTAVAATAWALGGLLLSVAVVRDPDGRALAALRTSGAIPPLVVAALAIPSISALALPWTLVGCAALLAVLACVSLWAVSGPRAWPAQLLKRIASAAVVLVFSAVLAELVLRLPAVVEVTGGHRPGNARWERERYDRLWEGNDLKLRSRHLGQPKPAGTRQILTLGDEATFGALIARTEDTWPYVLETSLLEEGEAVEVVNAGQRGFTTANEAEWLEREGARFDPDLLIVQFGMNDTVPSYPNYRAEGSFWYYHFQPLLRGLDPYLATRSYLYSALDAFKEHRQMRLRPEGYRPLYEDGFAGWKQAQDALHRIAVWAHARGISVLLAVFPDLEPDTVLTQDGYRYAPLHEKVRGVAETEGMHVLDLLPVFAAEGKPPETWWPRVCEPLPGPQAQRLAARAIREEIDRKRLLRSASPPAAHS